MKTKFICVISTLIIISTFFLSCSKDNPTGSNVQPVDTSDFKYPFTIGSTWSYTRVQSVENIRPDSIAYHFNMFPFNATGSITISNDTSINGVQTRCFLETYTEDTTNWYSSTYYANYDSGFFCYGYRSTGGGAGFPFGPNQNIKFLFNDITYNNINEIFVSYGLYSNPKFISNDTLYLEDPPVNCVKYPIKIGTEWFFKRIDIDLYIHKKYLGFENILINNNMISCVKTERKWFGLKSETFFYDYHSKHGQMKRDYYFKDIICTNEFGDTIGFFDLRDIVNVTSFNIVEP